MTKKQKIREDFRNSVFKRDGNKCKLCGNKTAKLDAHHIWNREDMPNGGYVKENGITLCDQEDGCHVKVEKFYMSDLLKTDTENQLHPNNLYKLIGSSYELAVKKSELL